jgi:hypothetical protein
VSHPIFKSGLFARAADRYILGLGFQPNEVLRRVINRMTARGLGEAPVASLVDAVESGALDHEEALSRLESLIPGAVKAAGLGTEPVNRPNIRIAA